MSGNINKYMGNSLKEILNSLIVILFVVCIAVTFLVSNGIIPEAWSESIISFTIERLFNPLGLLIKWIFGVSLISVVIGIIINKIKE